MLRLLSVLFLFSPLLASADDNITTSPKGTFKIVQHYDDKAGFSEVVHFNDNSQPDVVLEGEISWAGDYYISPDDRWIFRIQKTGSGDNQGYLYFIEKNGAVWQRQQRLLDDAFAFLSHRPAGLPGDMYHDGLEFISWDLKNHRLNFSVHASSDSRKRVHENLIYELLKNQIVAP